MTVEREGPRITAGGRDGGGLGEKSEFEDVSPGNRSILRVGNRCHLGNQLAFTLKTAHKRRA